MHVERYGLPADVGEVFFSDRYWYASSEATNKHYKPLVVGVGGTKEAAIADMRQLLKAAPQSGG